MIKAIIFDCFGVLTTDAWLPFKADRFGHDEALNQTATKLNNQASAGLISHGDFIREVSKLANMPPDDVNQAIDKNVTNETLFEYIARLKHQYKIGLLSNAAGNWLRELFTPEQVALFDAVNLSYEEGYIKPNAIIYQRIAGQLGVEPNECVFIDDKERHCVGARKAGMRAVRYEGFEQMKAELETLLAADAKG